ncbi:hypothetical protein UlMin_012072 [Ulmus minor]
MHTLWFCSFYFPLLGIPLFFTGTCFPDTHIHYNAIVEESLVRRAFKCFRKSFISGSFIRIYMCVWKKVLYNYLIFNPELIYVFDYIYHVERIKAVANSVLSIQHVYNPETSPAEYARANKELRKLSASMDLINELRAKQKEINGLKSVMVECSHNKDMVNMATEELDQALDEEKRLHNLLLKSMLPKDADERDCISEVKTGGEEAFLFAMDIFKMCEKYSQKKGWKFEVVDEASAAISGAVVYGKLKFESGIHRVQQVPVTEKFGRVHTSVVSIDILPQADEVDVQLRNEDLRIDTYRSGGYVGQHANTTNSAIRIIHIPTGMIVVIQDEGSQHMNKAKALKVLCAKLYEIERSRIHSSRSKLRLEIGSGDKLERNINN